MARKPPATIKAATALLEQYASLDAQIAGIEANRQDSIADVNARCDTAATNLIKRRSEIEEQLRPWWDANAAELTQGKRKSIELGGCMIGSRTGRASLEVKGDVAEIAGKLRRRKWAERLIRVTVSLDRSAIMRALDGGCRRQLQALGLRRKDGEEAFYIERTQQGGTLTGSE